MARRDKPGVAKVYEFYGHWLTEALGPGDSLLTPGVAIWTSENLAALDGVYVDAESEEHIPGKYLDRLLVQLKGQSDGAIQLMAEVHVVHFLMLSSAALLPATKIQYLRQILSLVPEPPAIPESIERAMAHGIVHPGMFTISRPDVGVTWLIRFSRRWKEQSSQEQGRLASDPWELREFVATIGLPGSSTRSEAPRRSLLHLAQPDTFEPIVSHGHPARIIQRFGAETGVTETDEDRALLQIREALTPRFSRNFHWYEEPNAMWNKDQKEWDAYLGWCRRFRELADFDVQERDYKLAAAQRMGLAREALLAGDDGWPQLLRKGFNNQNVTAWQAHDAFAKWAEAEPAAAATALRAIWQGSDEPGDRIAALQEQMPDDLVSTPGQRLNLASFLLMAERPHDWPPAKVTAIKSAWALSGWAAAANADDPAVLYRHFVAFCQELCHDVGPLRDPLDAQSAMWSIYHSAKPEDRPASWSDELWQSFLAYRGGTVTDVKNGEDDDDPTGPDEPAWRRRRYETFLAGWQEDVEAQVLHARREAVRATSPVEAGRLLDELEAGGTAKGMAQAMHLNVALPTNLRSGSHQMFVTHIANKAADQANAAQRLAAAYRAPVDGEQAEEKLADLHDLVSSMDGVAPWSVGMVPLAASCFWAALEPDRWPPLWRSAEKPLKALGWFGPSDDPAGRYSNYRTVIEELSDNVYAVPEVLVWVREHHVVGVDPSGAGPTQPWPAPSTSRGRNTPTKRRAPRPRPRPRHLWVTCECCHTAWPSEWSRPSGTRSRSFRPAPGTA